MRNYRYTCDSCGAATEIESGQAEPYLHLNIAQGTRILHARGIDVCRACVDRILASFHHRPELSG